jgi:isoquinoline 1-oxidoreductase
MKRTSSFFKDVLREGTASAVPKSAEQSGVLTPEGIQPESQIISETRSRQESAKADNFAIEPERYELRSNAIHHFNLQRRDFFKVMGAGIAIFTVAANASAAQESGARRHHGDQDQPKDISSWLHINDDGIVTVTGKVEVGQNTRTTLAQSVADELRVPLASIRMVMGDTALTPFDMGTFGSRSTPYMSPQLRRAASAARDLLLAKPPRNGKPRRRN